MKRDPFKQYIKDPDRRAKLYLFVTGSMIISTALIAIGTVIFILLVLGIV